MNEKDCKSRDKEMTSEQHFMNSPEYKQELVRRQKVMEEEGVSDWFETSDFEEFAARFRGDYDEDEKSKGRFMRFLHKLKAFIKKI